MSTKKKKVLSLFLALVMVFSLLPASGLAAGTSFTAQRFYIVSDTDPSQEDLGKYVQLADSLFAAKNNTTALSIVYGAAKGAQAGDIVVSTSSELTAQSYQVTISDGMANVTGGDAIGAYYGLIELLKGNTDASDTPLVEERSVYIDCGRIYYSPDLLKALIHTMSWNKMNTLYLDFSNNNATRFFLDEMKVEVDGTPYDITEVKPSQYLNEKDMDGILAEAEKYGVQIIPTFNSPGHIGGLYSLNNDFFVVGSATDYDRNCGKITLNIAKSDAYAFGQAVVKLYVDYFAGKGCKSFNIAADEATLSGVTYDSSNATFVSYVNDLAKYIQSKTVQGEKMTARMFNDGIHSTTSGLDTSIIVLYWAPNEATAEGLVQAGHQLVNFSYSAGLYYAFGASWWVWNQSVTSIYSGWTPGVLSRNTGNDSNYYQNNYIIASSIETSDLLGANFAVWSDYAFNYNKDGTAILNANDKNVIEKIHVVADRCWKGASTANYSTWKNSLTTAPGGIDVSTYKIDSTSIPAAPAITKAETGEVAENVTKTDTTTNISATAPGLTALTVATKQPSTIESANEVVSYTVELKTADGSYTGKTTLSIPIPTEWTNTSLVRGYVMENGTAKIIAGTAENGMYTFTVPHLSEVGLVLLAESAGGEGLTNVPDYTEKSVKQTSNGVQYVLDTDGIDTGVPYLIVASNYAKALSRSNSTSVTAVDVTISGNIATISNADNALWVFDGVNSGTVKNGSYYLRYNNNNNLSANTNTSSSWNFADKSNGQYDISYTRSYAGSYYTSTYHLRCSANRQGTSYSWTVDTSSNTVRLYKQTDTTAYTVDTSNLDALIEFAKGLTASEFSNWDAAAVAGALTAAENAKSSVQASYSTEADATTAQNSVNSAAEDLYNALNKLKYKAKVEITVKCVDENGKSIGDGTYTFYAYENGNGSYSYSITAPSISGYQCKDTDKLTGTTTEATTITLTYEEKPFSIEDSIEIPITIVDYRADGLLFDFQVGGNTYPYGLIHAADSSSDGTVYSVNGGSISGTNYGTKISGTTLENTGYVSSDSYSGQYYFWGNKWSRSGMVESELGANGMPVYTDATVKRVAQELADGKYNSSEMATVENDNDIIYNTFVSQTAERPVYGTSDTAMSSAFSAAHTWANITNAYDLAWYLLNTLYQPDTNTKSITFNGTDYDLPIYGMNVDAYDKLILKGTNGVYGLDAAENDIKYDTVNRAIYADTSSSSLQFYPIDGLGYDAIFGNTTDKASLSYDTDSSGNKVTVRPDAPNGSFTLRGEAQFIYYKSGLYFEFSGDDDVYLYINGKLVLDLGGAHGICTKHVDLDDVATTCGLTDGSVATFTFFYMERNSDASNFKIETNIELAEREIEVQKDAYGASYASKVPNNSSVVTGTTIAYDLIVTNKSNVSMNQIKFEDTDTRGGSASFGYDVHSPSVTAGNNDTNGTVSLGKKDSYVLYVTNKNGATVSGTEKTYSSLSELSNAVAGIPLAPGQSLHVRFLTATPNVDASKILSYTNTIKVTANAGGQTLTDSDIHTITSYNAADTTKSYVVDYGLPLDITNIFDESAKTYIVNNALTLNEATKPTYGKVEITGTGFNTKLHYERNSDTTTIDGVDTIVLNVVYNFGDGKPITLQKSVRIVPATTVYYEEGLATFYDGAANWTDATEKTSPPVQALDKLGASEANVYGYDPAYASGTTYSMGNAKEVTVNQSTNANAPTASFTFQGTGFDIISLTDSQSGAIYVKVYRGTDISEENIEKSLFVNNYYGYTYENGKWTATPVANNALYQVPVMKVNGLEYGTYTAVITVGYSSFQDVAQKNKYSFWLDAIRIYDPAGKMLDNDYKQDGENSPAYQEVRDVLLGAQSFDEADVSVSGAVFIDGNRTIDNTSISEYENYGPNNEAYLTNGQAIAFQLVASSKPTDGNLQLGIKLAQGSKGTVNVLVDGKEKILIGSTNVLNTATDMYYKLADVTWTKSGNVWMSSPIVIKNTGNENSIISLTNVKITGGYTFTTLDAIQTRAAPMQVAFFVNADLVDFAHKALVAEPVQPSTGGGGGGGGGSTGGVISSDPTNVPGSDWKNPYDDVKDGSWYYDYVKTVTEAGLMNGQGSGFGPDGKLTRAMMVTILYRMSGSPAVTGENPFTDVPAGTWYSDAVLWAYDKGVVKGTSETTFAPTADITRQDMATIIARYAAAFQIELKAADGTTFSDDSAIAGYAKDAVYSMKASGILSGKGNDRFDPQGTTTRAETAKVIALLHAI